MPTLPTPRTLTPRTPAADAHRLPQLVLVLAAAACTALLSFGAPLFAGAPDARARTPERHRDVQAKPRLAAATPDAKLTAVLRAHVRPSGLVDYDAVCADTRLATWLSIAEKAAPVASDTSPAALAYWINLYNAATLRVVCQELPFDKMTDLGFGGEVGGAVLKTSIWDAKTVRVRGRVGTLNDIEHGIIRRDFSEPRIHFALVCAARSCPPLRREAYTAAALDAQLDDQARTFLATAHKNAFDKAGRRASLSKIFEWYGADFTKTGKSLQAALAPWAPAGIALSEAWSIAYRPYDWTVNDVVRPKARMTRQSPAPTLASGLRPAPGMRGAP